MSVEQGQASRSLDLTDDLTPPAIEAFLRVAGWQQTDRREGISAIWRLDNASLMLPYNSTFRDFPDRLRDALRAISEVHNIQDTESLALEIIGAQSDIIFLKADQATFEGSIPLAEARNLLSGARKMIIAAACSAIHPRPSFRGRKPEAALEFAQEVRMGHTLRGSFVLTLIARHIEIDATESLQKTIHTDDETSSKSFATAPLDHPGESYTRRVMTTLATGLEAANNLLQDEPPTSLDEAVQYGASAELLSSIEEMGDNPGLRALDISFRWSPAQPPPPASISSRIVVPRAAKERIQAVRASMLKQPDVAQDEIVGQVIRLERSEDQDEGVIVIDGYLGRTRHRIKVSLADNNYRVAIRAHEAQRPIVATGRIVKEKQTWWLRGVVTIRPALERE